MQLPAIFLWVIGCWMWVFWVGYWEPRIFTWLLSGPILSTLWRQFRDLFSSPSRTWRRCWGTLFFRLLSCCIVWECWSSILQKLSQTCPSSKSYCVFRSSLRGGWVPFFSWRSTPGGRRFCCFSIRWFRFCGSTIPPGSHGSNCSRTGPCWTLPGRKISFISLTRSVWTSGSLMPNWMGLLGFLVRRFRWAIAAIWMGRMFSWFFRVVCGSVGVDAFDA